MHALSLVDLNILASNWLCMLWSVLIGQQLSHAGFPLVNQDFTFQWGEGETTAVVVVVAIALHLTALTDLLIDHMAAAAALPTDHMAAAAAALTTEEGGNWDSDTRLLTLWNLFSNPSHVVSLCSLRCSSLKARRF